MANSNGLIDKVFFLRWRLIVANKYDFEHINIV